MNTLDSLQFENDRPADYNIHFLHTNPHAAVMNLDAQHYWLLVTAS